MGHNRRPFTPVRDGAVTTIGQAHATRRPVWAFCRNCAHSEAMDTWRLIQRLKSRDVTLEQAAQRLRCRHCLNAAALLIVADGFAHR